MLRTITHSTYYVEADRASIYKYYYYIIFFREAIYKIVSVGAFAGLHTKRNQKEGCSSTFHKRHVKAAVYTKVHRIDFFVGHRAKHSVGEIISDCSAKQHLPTIIFISYATASIANTKKDNIIYHLRKKSNTRGNNNKIYILKPFLTFFISLN